MTDKEPTMGDVITAAHKGALGGPESDGTVEIVGMIVDSMMAGQAHTQALLDGLYEDARDELDIVQSRIRRIMKSCPTGGTTREYEQILSLIQSATYVSSKALDAYRASPDGSRELSLVLPRHWEGEYA